MDVHHLGLLVVEAPAADPEQIEVLDDLLALRLDQGQTAYFRRYTTLR
jgi:hypothetical protein